MIQGRTLHFWPVPLYRTNLLYMMWCETWTIKKAEHQRICFQTVVLDKTFESLLGCKETKPVHPKGNESWIFIGRADAEAPILWPPDTKNWLTGKDLDTEKDWRKEEKLTTEDEMVGWHHQLNGHEFEQALLVMDREAWNAAVHGVIKSQIQLSD